ncbi:MAG: DNA polymerase IV [Ignavibacteriae bacterium]|nr:DNA polymerase IV [Ignavibacteriota bacterium]
MPSPQKYIAHLDLDCFFVSVERIKDPSLNGKPVVVGGSPKGRGVVASASYEARKFGVRSAMPAAQALRLCPQLIFVRGSHGEYGEYSNKIYKRLCEIAPIVERASIDELYLDFTGCEAIYNNDLPGFMKILQKMVWEEFQLPCTIALASNKTVAKIATGAVKPAGVCYIPPGTEKEFLAPMPIDVIPGVGAKTSESLKRRGINSVRDMQNIPRGQAADMLGKFGSWIYNAANGMGSDVVSPEHERKSVGHEETFTHDIGDTRELEKILFRQAEEVCSSLRRHGWKAKTITLKLRYSDFKTITRAQTIKPTDDDPVVFKTVKELLHKAYNKKQKVRLIGVRVSEFVEEEAELQLFSTTGARKNMLSAVDRIRKKFGDDVIHVGGA